jgi:hypothetical protein
VLPGARASGKPPRGRSERDRWQGLSAAAARPGDGR